MTSEALVLIGNDKGGSISAFRLLRDELLLLASTQVGVGCNTFAVDTERSLVYAATKEPQPAVVTLRLERSTGEMSEVSRRDVDDPLAYLSLSGDVLLGASYHGGWGASWRVTDGVVGEVVSRLHYRNLHAAVPGADGQNAYFVSLGEDLIAQFSLGADGHLTPLADATLACPPGSGPRHLVLSPDGRNAYLVTEFTGEAIRLDRGQDGSLTVAESVPAYDTARNLGVSAYGRDPRANHLIWGADLALGPDGDWLVCSERTESTIVAIPVEDNGRLGDSAVVSDTEEQPRGLAMSPDGSRLVVVGERSGSASLYRIDGGALVQVNRVETGLGPNWVRFV
ncbi:MAG: beta-propeller fold lactonase family protein [Propionibacteriaceae bacterium]|nr:beta-propeller fold lactonase family protein [Propionibacteriaceae bacterium]